MKLAAARSTNCGKGTAIAPSESSGSGTHARIVIAARFRRDNATASAVPVVVMLMGVPKVLISRRKPCSHTIETIGTREAPRQGDLDPSFK
jgi:hypothetical protein